MLIILERKKNNDRITAKGVGIASYLEVLLVWLF
jgi:hypothetical protein